MRMRMEMLEGGGEEVSQLQKRGGAGMGKGNEKWVCMFSLEHSGAFRYSPGKM